MYGFRDLYLNIPVFCYLKLPPCYILEANIVLLLHHNYSITLVDSCRAD